MPFIVISGAGSGIGHTFLAHLASDANNTIHAIDVTWNEEVSAKQSNAKITHHTVNTADASTLDKLGKDLDGHPIDLFIHSAAVRGLVPSMLDKTSDPKGAETLDVMDRGTMVKCLDINITGSFLLIRTLLPGLKKNNGKCVIMGSRMGSMGANGDGGAYAYRASKAGLNAIIKSLSIDVPEVIFTIIHPGKVDTRMTHVREEGSIDSSDVPKILMPMIEKFGKKDSGQFYTRDGEKIPW